MFTQSLKNLFSNSLLACWKQSRGGPWQWQAISSSSTTAACVQSWWWSSLPVQVYQTRFTHAATFSSSFFKRVTPIVLGREIDFTLCSQQAYLEIFEEAARQVSKAATVEERKGKERKGGQGTLRSLWHHLLLIDQLSSSISSSMLYPACFGQWWAKKDRQGEGSSRDWDCGGIFDQHLTAWC